MAQAYRTRASSSIGNFPVGLDLDGSLYGSGDPAHPAPPPPVARPKPVAQRWFKGLLSFCLAAGGEREGERSWMSDSPAKSERKRRERSPARTPPTKNSPLHYAGIGRPWTSERELFFRARLEEARSCGAILVLLRHGESEWNAADRFTGWHDIGITNVGREESRRAGRRLAAAGIDHFDDLHSSALKRTVDTLELTMRSLNGRPLPLGTVPRDVSTPARKNASEERPMTHCRSWQLNERHYGGLTGVDKTVAREQYGMDQVKEWRRGWFARPPAMSVHHDSHKRIVEAYEAAGGDGAALPTSESLAETEARVVAYLHNAIVPQLRKKRTVLVAAHNNVIRTIIHHLDGSDDLCQPDGDAPPPDAEAALRAEERGRSLEAQLANLEIPYATPLVYTFAHGPYGKLYPFADEMQRGVIRGTFLE